MAECSILKVLLPLGIFGIILKGIKVLKYEREKEVRDENANELFCTEFHGTFFSSMKLYNLSDIPVLQGCRVCNTALSPHS
jgi:hypothetical protein